MRAECHGSYFQPEGGHVAFAVVFHDREKRVTPSHLFFTLWSFHQQKINENIQGSNFFAFGLTVGRHHPTAPKLGARCPHCPLPRFSFLCACNRLNPDQQSCKFNWYMHKAARCMLPSLTSYRNLVSFVIWVNVIVKLHDSLKYWSCNWSVM